MSSPRSLGILLRWFMTLALPFLLAVGSLRLLLSYEFLRFEYTRPAFPSDPYGMTKDDRLEFGMYAIGWLFSADDTEALVRLRLPADKCWLAAPGAVDCPLFNAKELSHLADVKQILHIAFMLAGACLILAVAAVFIAWRRQWSGAATMNWLGEIRRGIRRGAWLTLALLLFLAVSAFAAWDLAFDLFHRLFFAAGTWRFPFSDSLIRLYPEQLFVDAALAFGVVMAAGALIVLGWLEARARRSAC